MDQKLWYFGTGIDQLLRACGFLCACAAGSALPLMTIVFGKFVNDFNGWANGTISPGELRSTISKNAIWLVYLFIAKGTVGVFDRPMIPTALVLISPGYVVGLHPHDMLHHHGHQECA